MNPELLFRLVVVGLCMLALVAMVRGGARQNALGLTIDTTFRRWGDAATLLRRMQQRLTGVEVDPSGCKLRAQLGGRELRLSLEDRGVSRHVPFRLEVELPHAPPVRLRVRRRAELGALRSWLGRWRDVPVADGGDFDAEHVVDLRGEAARLPLTRPELREAVRQLLALQGVEQLEIREGRLTVTGVLPATFGKRPIRRLYRAVAQLAQSYDRHPALELNLDIAPQLELGPFVWTGGGDEGRCPYCHDDLGDEPLVACAACGTLLHAECHQELKVCPVLGCGNTEVQQVVRRSPERGGPSPERLSP